MKRHFFNTTGPCNPEYHYMLPPEDRLVGSQLHRYIKDQLYWVLHAPRQTGKTTFLQSWEREINAGGEAVACYVSIERCDRVSEAKEAMPAICDAIREAADNNRLPVPSHNDSSHFSMLNSILKNWSELVAPKPLIVLFDEVDVLVDETMVSFLRQLRGGFATRGIGTFPVSIALVGMRDLKDYLIKAKDGKPVNPGSPFYIKADSAILSNFIKDDVVKLFAQRTEETGQQITQEALDYVYEQSKGQPWIVNSLFMRATLRILDAESTETVTLEHIRKAREQMIEARETHLDSLGERLRDPRVKSVIQTIITGSSNPLGRTNPDVNLTLDLGLVKWSSDTGFTIANPVYEEILTRYISSEYHDSFPPPSSWQWQKPNGELDMDSLLLEFQKFWRRHSEIWEEKADYTEAFPHLLLMAFLQRVTNGSGDIDRELAAGRGRMDLLVEYAGKHYIIEVKIIHYYDGPAAVREEGLTQIKKYRDRIDASAPAYLVIFDRRPKAKELSWDEKISWTVDEESKVTILGC
ncbi:MAG: PD-(D/E)XK nuclease domain-containing protein [Tannerella sp.]|nr:PD-(D/E)XK nuclease domain-containing protein [Tannerella sp.]